MNPHNRLDLTIDGYHPTAPSTDAADIDREWAEKTPCRKCGGPCRYEPWSQPGSYRAFAICLDCGHEEEF